MGPDECGACCRILTCLGKPPTRRPTVRSSQDNAIPSWLNACRRHDNTMFNCAILSILSTIRGLGPPQIFYANAINVPPLVEISAVIVCERLYVSIRNLSATTLAFVPQFVSTRLFVGEKEMVRPEMDRILISEQCWVAVPQGRTGYYSAAARGQDLTRADTAVVYYSGKRPYSLEYLSGRSTQPDARLPKGCDFEVPLFRATWILPPKRGTATRLFGRKHGIFACCVLNSLPGTSISDWERCKRRSK
jgi:hypothetical protein